MKKLLLSLILVLFAITVTAGEINTLDFSNSPIVVEEVKIGGLIKFTLENKTHEIIAKEISSSGTKIKLRIFVEGSDSPTSINLGYNQQLRLDFYKSGIDDMVIVLESITADGARLIFRLLDEEGNIIPTSLENSTINNNSSTTNEIVDNQLTGNVISDNSTPSIGKGLLITAIIIITGLIIFSIVKK